jgi:hypothetical protein
MSILMCLILACIAIGIFAVYNACVIGKFGVPSSLSVSYYLWNGLRSHLGYIFTGMMFAVSMLLMPAWLEITEVISSWSHNLTVLPFFGAAMIAFVGAAPAFRSCEMESKVHTISATAAAVFSLLWCAVVCYKLAWIILPLSLGIVWGIAFLTKTQKTASVYWWEMVAFLATFATIVTECIILL